MKATFIASALTLMAGALSFGCSVEAGSGEELGQDQEAVIGTDTFLYFRSNASGWGVDDHTRLLPFVAGTFARRVDVTQPWMVAPGTGDTAIITETNQLNGWGTSQTFSGAVPKSVVEPATGEVVFTPVTQPPGGDSHFTVKYSSSGPHRALFDPSNGTFHIGPISCPQCPSELHCIINDNSLPTCG